MVKKQTKNVKFKNHSTPDFFKNFSPESTQSKSSDIKSNKIPKKNNMNNINIKPKNAKRKIRHFKTIKKIKPKKPKLNNDFSKYSNESSINLNDSNNFSNKSKNNDESSSSSLDFNFSSRKNEKINSELNFNKYKFLLCKACDIRGNCFSCNNELGYYQIEDLNGENQDNNGIIKCAKDPEGFYLSGVIYKKCHEKCKSCTDAGEDKCIECNPQFEFRNDFPDDKKCYKKCSFNYYYDSDNNNVCTPNSDCPNDMKLVVSKKRCIDHCKNENIFKFEFEGKCFENCPEGTRNSFEDNSICELVPEETDEKEEETECNLKLNEFVY